MDGKLLSNLARSDFRGEIERSDIFLVQETHLRPDQKDMLREIEGFEVLSMARDMPAARATYGGVCAYVRSSLHAVLCPEWCSPDILVFRVGDMHFVNAYIAGEGSSAAQSYPDWQGLHPRAMLRALLDALTEAGVTYCINGDLNGWVGNLCPLEDHPSRITVDPRHNDQGEWIVQLCNDFRLRLANGCLAVPGTHDGFTFFGHKDPTASKGKSIIDYVLLSPAATPRLSQMDILTFRDDLSDHAPIR